MKLPISSSRRLYFALKNVLQHLEFTKPAPWKLLWKVGASSRVSSFRDPFLAGWHFALFSAWSSSSAHGFTKNSSHALAQRNSRDTFSRHESVKLRKGCRCGQQATATGDSEMFKGMPKPCLLIPLQRCCKGSADRSLPAALLDFLLVGCSSLVTYEKHEGLVYNQNLISLDLNSGVGSCKA